MDKDRMNGAFESNSEAEVVFSSIEWQGAVLFYLINLGQVPFEELHVKKYRTKNVIFGYLFNLSFVATFYLMLYYFVI